MKAIKKVSLGILSVLKLDPVKFALYHVTKQIVIYGAKALAKSTKNTLDDKIVDKIYKSLND